MIPLDWHITPPTWTPFIPQVDTYQSPKSPTWTLFIPQMDTYQSGNPHGYWLPDS